MTTYFVRMSRMKLQDGYWVHCWCRWEESFDVKTPSTTLPFCLSLVWGSRGEGTTMWPRTEEGVKKGEANKWDRKKKYSTLVIRKRAEIFDENTESSLERFYCFLIGVLYSRCVIIPGIIVYLMHRAKIRGQFFPDPSTACYTQWLWYCSDTPFPGMITLHTHQCLRIYLII